MLYFPGKITIFFYTFLVYNSTNFDRRRKHRTKKILVKFYDRNDWLEMLKIIVVNLKIHEKQWWG